MALTDSIRLAAEELLVWAGQGWHDAQIWLSLLSDFERLLLIVLFILLLLILILLQSKRRASEPSSGRNFPSALLLVVVFSFGAGWILDSRFDIGNVF